MVIKGTIRKMRVDLQQSSVNYHLPIGNSEIFMNDLIGKTLSIEYFGQIFCIKCGKHTYKSFSQGFCYSCLTTAPEAEECVLHPELCRAHEGIARDMDYANTHCLCNQYVYLAVASGIKVGVTRYHQIPTRWIDQGASFATPIAIAPNRYTAGIIEVTLKPYFGDKTQWQKMLKNEIAHSINLEAEREKAHKLLPTDLQKYAISNHPIVQIQYPVKQYPKKIKTINLDTNNAFAAKLSGIKGQYLLFADDTVLNIRKFAGYELTLQF